MATKTEKAPSKTAFVRAFLRRNSTANRKAVEQAWREAGYEGSISSALVSNLRREMGLTGNQRDDSRPADGNGAAGSPKAKARKSKPKKRVAATFKPATPPNISNMSKRPFAKVLVTLMPTR